VVSHDDQVIPTLLQKNKKNVYEEEDFGPDAYPDGKPPVVGDTLA
jgi:hypothetical protein